MSKKIYKKISVINQNGQVSLGPNARYLPFDDAHVLVEQIDENTWVIKKVNIEEKSK